jgi:hypothetical protein
VNFVLLGYDFHRISYRLLIVKYKVSHMHGRTTIESNHEMPSTSSEELAKISEPTISMEHHANHVEDYYETIW